MRGLPAAAAALLLAAACGGGGGPAGPGPGGPTDSDGDGLSDAQELSLALQYRPVWAFDAAEEIWPIAVEAWAAAGGRVVRAGTERAYADPAGLLAAVRALPDGTIETAGEVRRGTPPCAEGAGCDDAPVYVDAVPAGFSLDGRSNLVWLHYWLLFHFDQKTLAGADLSHYGDWEHVCVLVSLDDLGEPDVPPVGLHFHSHGVLKLGGQPLWQADPACAAGGTAPGCRGTRHPTAYVEANGHGVFPDAGVTAIGPHLGARLYSADQLDNPLVFLTPHATHAGGPAVEAIRLFRGRWGQTPDRSPFGPLVPTGACDHDYDPSPTLADWLPACRDGS